MAIFAPMRLEQLYIKGFKSFANETVIHFNERVTGIVGPNGSGKSNIVDAIRWVLGEQKSRELRLEKMGDVLFNGTKKRKPGPVAKVNLTFSNDKGILPTEYNTVNIARTLYRSGESEYLLNDVPCRLKDIQSLFIDTGIGSDSYAIIALGMVDDILADKENARSKMFEQAAGISKYKKRKKETLLKLKGTEEDLNRVEDLLYEIEDNLKSLERQARRTKKYFEIKEQYKNLSIQLSVARSRVYTDQFNTLSKTIQSLEDQILELDAKRVTKDSEIEQERLELVNKEKGLSELQKALSQLLNSLREQESNLQITQQQQQFAEQNITQLKHQREDAESKIAGLTKELKAFNGALEKAEEEVKHLQERQSSKEAEYQKLVVEQSDAKDALLKLQTKKKETDSRVAEFEKRRAINQDRKSQLAVEVQRIQEKTASITTNIANTQVSIRNSEKEEKLAQNQLLQLRRMEDERIGRLEHLEQTINSWSEKESEVHRKIDAKKNERDLLKNMVDKLEGFPESIKFLSKQWSQPAPILSDLLYCDEKYRPAIEYVLENYLNHYVVNDLDEALSAINLLSNSQQGKANFFILNQIPNRATTLDLVPHAIPALDLIELEDKYKPLFHYLLNGVYLVKASEWSSQVKTANDKITLLSENGSVVRKGHWIAGGSIGLFEGKKLGRKKNLEKLDSDLDSLRKKKDSFEAEILKLKKELILLKEGNLAKQIKEAESIIVQLEKARLQFETQLKSWEQELHELDKRQLVIIEQIDSIDTDDKSIIQELNELSETIGGIDQKVDIAGGDFGFVDEQLSKVKDELNQVKILVIQAQNKCDQLKREALFRENQLQDLNLRIENYSNQLQLEEDKSIELLKKVSGYQNALTELRLKRKEQSTQLNDYESRFFEERNKLSLLEKELRTINTKIQERQTELSRVKDEFSAVNLKVHSISERLEAEFNISLELATEHIGSSSIELNSDAEEVLAKIKLRLQNFGEINPLAVEAYDAMKERFDTISAQRSDIVEARDSLQQTIQEIETKATEQFMAAFNEVQSHFRNVFRELFTEDDDCDLILLDEENPLESAIEIVAKPKGKRPKSLSQLSGGEKTLTATALLFALYLLKPAPFCIFDEVDAPLDDANIQKFNRIIKKFSNESQFIIITHNKLTMASVDVIYGVFMEETGISNVSAVDFRHLEHNDLVLN